MFWSLLERMEAKTKSGTFLAKSCGPALDLPTRIVVRTTKKLLLFFDVAPYLSSEHVFQSIIWPPKKELFTMFAIKVRIWQNKINTSLPQPKPSTSDQCMLSHMLRAL